MMCAQHSQYLPLISGVIGFVSAVAMLALRECLDRKAKRYEAASIMLFHLGVLRGYVADQAPANSRAISALDDALRRMAGARFHFYEWPEMKVINQLNVEFASGQLSTMAHLDKKLKQLDKATEELKTRFRPYL